VGLPQRLAHEMLVAPEIDDRLVFHAIRYSAQGATPLNLLP